MANKKVNTLSLPGLNLAIIMDGNGRWAKKNALNVTSGHQQGVEVVREIVEASAEFNLESLTLYAFSTENWSRPKQEISGIKQLILAAIKKQVPDLIQQQVQLNFFGDYSSFGKKVVAAIKNAEEDTASSNPRLLLNIALGYGGRADITQGIQSLARAAKQEEMAIEDITQETIFEFLQAPLKELDLLIRTGGDHRLSNFLLYHLAYTEIQFLDTLWPSFSRDEFRHCLENFVKTERRFGKRTI